MRQPKQYVNIRNGDIWFCDNIKEVVSIDGVDYVYCCRPNLKQTHLMRKDVLRERVTVKRIKPR